MSEAEEGEIRRHERVRLAWLLIAVVYAMFGLLFTVIQPLTAPPDEAAHMQYVKFLASERRLPVWSENGGGEAGYEAQHPPLAYALQTLPWIASASWPENMRWHAVRWFMLLLGFLLFVLVRRLAAQFFPAQHLQQLAYGATVMLMPLSLLYFSHPNPDGIALILGAAALLLAARIHDDPDECPRLPWMAGALAALAALTKLSAMPLGLLLIAAQWLRPGQDPRQRLRKSGIILALWIAGAGWWYLGNLMQHGTPFIHTATKYDTGLESAAKQGLFKVLSYTLFETFVTIWVQRGWLPYVVDGVTYVWMLSFVLAAAAGFARRRRRTGGGPSAPGPSRFILGGSLFLVTTLFLGQQAAFWTQDMELNAGGRYLLLSMPAIAALVVTGLSRLGSARTPRILLSLWVAAILSMNIFSAKHIAEDLTPVHFPGWHMFEFPRR